MRVLVAGDVLGRLDALFARVAAAAAKAGPFDALFCVGDFFDSASQHGAAGPAALTYLQGAAPVPIPTYFIVGKGSEFELPEEGGEVCPNLHFLGKHGVRTIAGLNVAWVSGRFDPFVQTAGVSTITAYTPRSLQDVCTQAGSTEIGRRVDVLLTAEWPRHVLSTLPQDVEFGGGSKEIAHLAKFLQPRYHFAGSEGLFFARAPYRNTDASHVTRFYGLTHLSDASEKEKKWLHAMSLSPMAEMTTEALRQVPADVTDNPFLPEHIQRKEAEAKERKRAAAEVAEQAKKAKLDAPCWFCIDQVGEDARHLVVSHGSFVYLSLAKGGLVDFHLLLIPMEHFTGSHHIHEGIQEEIGHYIDALTAFFATQGQYLVMYERNIHINGNPCHMNLQVVPLSKRLAEEEVKAALLARGMGHGYSFDDYKDGDRLAEEFFLFALPSEKLIYRHGKKGKGKGGGKGGGKGTGGRFQLQFGRDVLAQLLGSPQRADWKACVRPPAEERRLADRFRQQFRPFDWTLREKGKDEG
eukprot:EG_transcript_8852